MAADYDDKPGPACYQPSMEWIIAAALAVGVLALVAVFVLRRKYRPGEDHNLPGLSTGTPGNPKEKPPKSGRLLVKIKEGGGFEPPVGD